VLGFSLLFLSLYNQIQLLQAEISEVRNLFNSMQDDLDDLQSQLSSNKSWHYLTDFTIASCDYDKVHMIVAYPNDNYSSISPRFAVTRDLWRIRWETIPYYNFSYPNHPEFTYIVYYGPSPSSPFKVYKDSELVVIIELLRLDSYNAGYEGHSSEGFYYTSHEYISAKSNFFFMVGSGTYYITIQDITGCFKFTIEEYY